LLFGGAEPEEGTASGGGTEGREEDISFREGEKGGREEREREMGLKGDQVVLSICESGGDFHYKTLL